MEGFVKLERPNKDIVDVYPLPPPPSSHSRSQTTPLTFKCSFSSILHLRDNGSTELTYWMELDADFLISSLKKKQICMNIINS